MHTCIYAWNGVFFCCACGVFIVWPCCGGLAHPCVCTPHARGAHHIVLRSYVQQWARFKGALPPPTNKHFVALTPQKGVFPFVSQTVSFCPPCCWLLYGSMTQGGTALMEAATSGSQEVVDLLLAAGADPMVRDKDGVSPLMSAAAQVRRARFFWGGRRAFSNETHLVLLLGVVTFFSFCPCRRWP